MSFRERLRCGAAMAVAVFFPGQIGLAVKSFLANRICAVASSLRAVTKIIRMCGRDTRFDAYQS